MLPLGVRGTKRKVGSMRILVIDDDVCLVRAFERMLKEHEVAIETDSSRAVERVVNGDLDGDPFDVVLCDVKMPGMNGPNVFAALRLLGEPPILLLMSGDDDVADAAGLADAVLTKPFRAGELLDMIERTKDRRARAATRRIRRILEAEIRFDDGGYPSAIAQDVH
jgi:DNA-binding response OmpR family regulator